MFYVHAVYIILDSGVMLHAFNPSTQRGRGRQIYVNFRHTWST